MSNHAAIAAVTSTLTTMIQKVVDGDGTVAGGRVTARPPDRARQGVAGNQINLFLYRTSIDAAWRNQDPQGLKPGENGQPPLPLVLSYLITAYGDNDDEILGHRLLGIAMGVLNDRPLLSRKDIAPGSDLENQVERVRITPDPRPQDEISRMWATFGTGYRLSVSYDAAVVLIDSSQQIVAPAPVLQRGSDDGGPRALAAVAPGIELVVPPNRQPAARPGDTVTVLGTNLGAVKAVRITGTRVAEQQEVPTSSATASSLAFQVPTASPMAAGIVTVSALLDPPDEDPFAAPANGQPPTAPAKKKPTPPPARAPLTSNAAPLALAPTIQGWTPKKPKLDASGNATVKVKCAPPVEAGQTIALIVGDQVFAAPSPTQSTGELAFAISGLSSGKSYPLRVRIDSVDSIPVAAPPSPATASEPAAMQFDPAQTIELA